MSNTTNTPSSATNAAGAATQISAVGVSGSGKGIREAIKIDILMTHAGQAPGQLSYIHQPGQAPVRMAVKPNAKIAIRMDGQEITGKQTVQGQTLKLRKVGAELFVETESGEVLVYLDDFYQTTDVMLVGADWSYTSADTLRLVNASEGVMAGGNLIVASSGAGWLGGGLGLAFAAGSGGGSTTAAANTPAAVEVLQKLAVTVVAGPVNTKLTALVYTADGGLLGAFETDPTGTKIDIPLVKDGKPYTGAIMVKVFDANKLDGKGFIDEATGQSKNLTAELRALSVAEVGKDLSVVVSPLTEAATRLAGIAPGQTPADKPLTATDVKTANQTVADKVGLKDDITTLMPKTVIGADGKANPDYNDTDGVDAAEKYGQILAMLSGLDRVNADHLSDAQKDEAMDKTLESFVKGLLGDTSVKSARDQLYAGAKAFEFGTDTDAKTNPTAGLANLLNEKTGAAPNDSALGTDTIARTLETPPQTLINEAFEDADDATNQTGGELKKDAEGNRYINSADADNGIYYPVPIPASAIAGDIVYLTIVDKDGNGFEFSYPLTDADILAGVAFFPLDKEDLGTDGLKTVTARVKSEDGSLDSGGYALMDFIVDTVKPTQGVPAGGVSVGTDATGPFTDATNDTTPTLRGKWDPVSTNALVNPITVTVEGKVYGTDEVKDAAGNITVFALLKIDGDSWELTIPQVHALKETDSAADKTEDDYTPILTLTDKSGNITTVNGTPFDIDTTAPKVEDMSGTLDPTAITGKASDGVTPLTKDTTPVLSGTSEPSSVVSVEINGITYTSADPAPAGSKTGVVVDAEGKWTLQIPATDALPGSASGLRYVPQITVTDAAGNSTTEAGTPFIVQLVVSATLDSTSDTAGAGLINGAAGSTTDLLTKNPTPKISGQAEANVKVDVTIAGITYTTTADDQGLWSITVGTVGTGVKDASGNEVTTPQSLTTGDYAIAITTTDLVGNKANFAGTLFKVDLQGPASGGITGGLTDAAASNTGDTADAITSNNKPTFSGRGEPGAAVSFEIKDADGNVVATLTGTVAADGTWTLEWPADLAALPDASGGPGTPYTTSITLTDAAGNETTKAGTAFTLDTTGPSAAGFSGGLDALSDGAPGITDDQQTSDSTPTLTGKAEKGAKVEVIIGDKTYTTTADADGNWSVAVTTALTDGDHSPTVKLTDAAGTVTEIANAFTFKVDTAPVAETAISGALQAVAGNDTGTLSDNLTSNRLPTLSGTTEAGSRVEVTVAGKTYTATVAADGTWSVPVGSETNAGAGLSNGFYTPQIKVTDAAGNITFKDGTEFQVDFTAPSLQGITGGLTAEAPNDSGTVGDNLTNDTTPTLSGTAEPGSTVVVTLKSSVPGAPDIVLEGVVVGEDGTWSVTAPNALADATYTPSVVATDVAGNASAPKTITPFTIDAALPSTATGGLNAASDTGSGTAGTVTDNRTNLANPVLTGTAEANAKVEVTVNGVVYTTTADASGNWTVPVSTALPEGSYTPSIKTTDAAGNTKTDSGTAFTVDLTLPASASIAGALETTATDASAATNSGSKTDALTQTRLPVLRGTTELATDKVEVIVNGKTYTATVAADKSWSVTVGSQDNAGAGLNNGFYIPQIKVTDAAGNITTLDGTEFQVDFTAPSLQAITGGLTSDADTTADANDSGTKGDNLTRDTTPTLNGTAEPGSTVVVTLKSSVAGAPDIVLTGVPVGTDGTWTVDVPSALADATYTPSVVATDVAGNASASKPITAFTIDNTAPDAPVGKLAVISDTGVDETKITKLQNPNLQGTAEANSVVTLSLTVPGEADPRVYTTTANSLGKWTVEVTGDPLPVDATTKKQTYTYTLSSTDKAGNVATATMTDNFTVDTDSASGNAGLATASDSAGPTGTSADRITKTTKPIIEGKVDNFQATDIVEVTIGGLKYSNAAGTDAALLITVISGGADNGKWSFTVRDDLAEGDHVPSVAVTTGGTTTTLNGTGFTVDLTAPTLGVTAALTRTAANDTGLVGDNLTNATKPLFNGTAESGASITLQVKSADGSSVIATVGPITVGANGQWVTTDSTPWVFTDNALSALPTATYPLKAIYTLNAIVTDKAGNVTTTALPGTDFEVDATGPSSAAYSAANNPSGFVGGLAEASNTGSTADTITSAAKPTLTGFAEAGAKVEVVIGTGADAKTYTTYADDTGAWSVAVTTALAGSTTPYSPTVKLTDAAGNTTIIDNAFSFTVDTSPPGSPTGGLDSAASNQTGMDGNTPLTKDSTPILSGTAPAGSVVEVTIGGVTYTNASPVPPGMTGGLVLTDTTWTLPVTTALTDGVQVPQIKVTDTAGNTTTANGTAFRVDTALPIAQSITGALTVDAASATPANDNDSGTKGDNRTRDTTPTFSGSAEAGSSVKLYVASSSATDATFKTDAQVQALPAVDAHATTGAWTATATSALTSTDLLGTAYTLWAEVTDKAGNTTLKQLTGFTLDATGPSSESPVFSGGLAEASNTGSTADTITSATKPTLTGKAEAGAKVEVIIGTGADAKTYTTYADDTGTWSVAVTAPLGDADKLAAVVYSPTVKLTDAAGNITTKENAFSFTVNTAPPAAPTGGLDSAAGNQTGTDGTTPLTKDSTPILSGTAPAGSVVEVTVGGVTYTNASPVPDGMTGGLVLTGTAWTLPLTTALTDGVHAPQIRVTDTAGNTTTSTGTPFRVDTAGPALFAISGSLTAEAPNDSGTVGDNLTNDTTPALSGTSEVGSTVKVEINGKTYSSTDSPSAITVNATTGAWTLQIPVANALPNGDYTPAITVTDKAGNATPKNGTPFTVDATAPTTQTGGAAITGALAAASDTGAADNITSDTTPTLTGLAEKGAKVVIMLDGKPYETIANPDTGVWTITAEDLGSTTKEWTPTITVTDKAGNVAGPIDLTPFTINTSAPLVSGALTVDASTALTANDSGTKGDNLTRDTTPEISGTAEAGAAVEVTIDSVIYKTNASTTDGKWAITIGSGGVNGAGTAVASHTLANGTYIPRIKVTNSVGVSATADGTPFTVDFNAPALTSINGALTIDTDITDNTLANDSGTKGDNTTRDTTPTFNGTAEVGSSVKLYVASSTATDTTFKTTAQVQALNAVIATGGNWSATVASALPSAGTTGTPYTLWAEVTDAAGNTSTKQLTNFTIDRVVPTATLNGSIKPDAINDTGVSTTYSITRNQSPVLTGKAEAGAIVQVTVTGGSPSVTKTYTATANASGDWTALVPDTLSAGDYTLSLSATDKAGNVQTGTGTGFKIDIALPDAPTGGLASGTTTTDTTPDLSGTSEKGSVVEVTVNGKTYSSAGTNPPVQVNPLTGAWTLTIPAADSLPGGNYLPQIKVTDAAGNSTTANGTAFTVSVSLNGELVHDTTNDTFGAGTTGTVNDNLTKNVGPKLSGSAPGNSDIEVTIAGVTYTSAASPVSPKVGGVTLNAGGWELQLPGTVTLANQTHNWTIKSIDKSNPLNTSTANGVAFTVDAQAPVPADISAGLANASNSGDKGDLVTNVANPVLTGQAEPNAAVKVEFNGVTYNVVANSQGIWTVTTANTTPLVSGQSYAPIVTVTDQAGNVTGPTTLTASAIKFDNVGPVVSGVSMVGLDGNAATRTTKSATLVAGDRIEVIVTMDEAVALVGRPTYTIDVGGVAKTATYDLEQSDPAAKKLVFAYTVKTGDLDSAGGINATATALNLPSGVTIKDAADNAILLTGTTAATPVVTDVSANKNTIMVDAVAPTIVTTTGVQITSNAGTDGTYKAGDTITFSVTFSEPVKFADDQIGLGFRLGNATVVADPDAGFGTLSATKTFTYTVKGGVNGDATGDNDTDGISIGTNPLVINSSSDSPITDAAGNNAVLSYATATSHSGSHKVDTTAPTVLIYADNIPTSTTKVRSAQTITFSFNEDPGSTFVWDPANPTALTNSLTVSGGTLGALTTVTKVGSVWITTAQFTPSASTEGNASISVASDKFKDVAGNLNKDGAEADNTLSFLVDTIAPVLQSIDVSDSVLIKTTSGALETATLTFKFSEVPVGFTVADIIVYENDGTTVAALGDYGAFGPLVPTDKEAVVVFTPLDGKARTIKFGVNANVFKDEAGNDNTAPLVSAGVEVATTAPSVQAVTITTTDSTGTANTGDTLVATDKVRIQVEYTTSVKLTGTAPKFEFFVGAQKREALLVTDENISTALKSAGGNFMVFEYTVLANTNLLTFNDGLISANAGALKTEVGTSVVAANNPSITASNGTPVAVLGDFATKAIVVDNVLPTVQISVDGAVSVLDAASANPTVRFVFSEAPIGFTVDAVTITGGGTLSNLVKVDDTTYTATYTPPKDGAAIDRTTVTLAIANNAVVDAAGNKNADGGQADNKVTFTVDTKVAVVSTLAITSTGTNSLYNTGDTITFTANFPENVFVTGFGSEAPFLEFKMGTDPTLRQAFYTAGSGTGALTFSYVVQPGDTDGDGISYAANAIKLNGQTIKDQIGNNANLNHALLSDAGAHKVDTTAPTVTLSVTGNIATLKKGETAEIVFTFSEDPVGFDGNDVTITGGGTLVPIGSKITNGNGTFSFKATYTPPLDAPAGTLVSITVPVNKFTDAAGNSNPAGNTVNFTVDTDPPAALGLTLTNDTFNAIDTAENQAEQKIDKVTNDTALTLTNVETGSTVQYRVMTVAGSVETEVMAWGLLSAYTAYMATSQQVAYKVYARQTDIAGNIGAESSIEFTKDSAAADNLVLALTTDTFADNVTVATTPGDFGTAIDKITSNAAFAASGAEMGAIVQYKVGSADWSTLYTAPTTDGEKVVLVRQIDKAGNISAEQTFEFTLDTKKPTLTSMSGALALGTTTPARPAEDTGANANDRLTNGKGGKDDDSISLAGQSEAGTYIKVVVKSADGTTTIGTYEAATSATTGEWTLDIPKTALPDGGSQRTYTYDIVSIDKAGNSETRLASTYTTQSFTVDYTAPTGTTGKLSALSDSGSSDTDARTNVTTPVLSGKAEANARISVLIAGVTYNTTADGNGDWSVKVETALVDAAAAGITATDAGGTLYDGWTITATDAAGNESTVIATTANGMAFTLDTKATATSLITGGLVKESLYDTGTSFTDGKTRNTRPNVEGTAEANAKVAVTLGGVVYNTTASSTGQWLISVTNPLAEGQHTPSIVVTDTAGNTVTHLGTQFTVDITAPLRPFITFSPMTNSRKPIITGTGEAGETIFVDVPGTAGTATKGSFQVVVEPNGTWSLNTATALELNSNTTGVFQTTANGAVVVEAYSFDLAGNLSVKSSQTLTVDTLPPDAPTITSAPTTSDKMPAIVGTGEIGATVTLTTTIKVNGVDTVVTTTAVVGSDGKWFINLETAVLKDSSGNTVAFTPLANNDVLNLSVSQTDPAGNTAAAPATGTLTIDTTLPVLTTVFDKSDPAVANPGLTTNDVTPIIKGTASPSQTVNITITGRNNDAITFQNIAVNAQGFWELNTFNDKAGVNKTQYKNASDVWVDIDPTSGLWSAVQQPGGSAYTVQVTQGTKSTTSVVILDVIIPAVSFGSNPISQDDIVNKAELDAGPVLTGTAEPGSRVNIEFKDTNGATVVRTATVNADGTWSYTLLPADVVLLGQSAKGLTGPVLDKPITVRATDPAGNTNTATRSIAIDTVLPVLDLNRADGLSLNWAVPLVDNSEYGFDNGADVNTTAASLFDVQSVNKITLAIDPASLKNGGDEVLLLGDVAFAANGNGAPASVLFAGVTWNVLYANGMFTFSATSVPATTAPVQAFFRNLRYQNKAAVIDVSGDRIFEIQVFDTAGNGSAKVTSTMTNDKTGPVIDLDGGNASANKSTVATSAQANAGVALVATSSLTDQNRIARVQVKVAGLRDGASEKLVVGATDLNADGSSLPATVSDGANTWSVTYLASTGEFLFNLPGGTATTVQANALLASLKYKNTLPTATDGARTFDITAVDSVNNITGTGAGSSVVQSSVVINGAKPDFAAAVAQVFTAATATAPAKSSTGRVITYDIDGDDVLGDQFELAFSELVVTAALTNRANWTASAGSLAGATITAVNPVTMKNVDGTTTQYARSFLFTGVTGHTTGTTFTVAAANVVGTAGAVADTAAAPVVFTMTDIVAPAAPTPPLDLSTDNLVNTTERAASTTVTFTHAAAVAGDIMQVYRDGQFIKNVSMTTGAVSTNVVLSGNDWGTDGSHSYTVRIQDTAGNLGAASAPKAVLVDSAVLPGIADLSVTSDTGSVGAPSQGDKLRVTFNEAVNLRSANLDAAFGTGATAVAVLGVGGAVLRNAGFNGSITSWTSSGAGAVYNAVSNGVAAFNANGDAVGNTLSQAMTTVVGNTYTVTYQQFNSSAGDMGLKLDALAGSTVLGTTTNITNASPGTFSLTFTATSTATTLRFTDTQSVAGGDLYLDNVKVYGGGVSTQWDITLGATPAADLAGKSVTFTAATDQAGNTANLSATVPTDAFDKPGEILIGNVTSDNVINTAERGAVQAVTLNLTAAKTGDVVKLMMDGVQVGQTTVGSNGQASVSIDVAANGWGADGERSLSASITRTTANTTTTITAPNRSVYVNADAGHWSTVNTGTIWFDPDTLVQAGGSVVTQWNASVGTSSTGGALNVNNAAIGTGTVLVGRDATGHVQVYFDGASRLTSNAAITLPTVSGGFSDFSLFKRITNVNDWQYTLTRYISNGGSQTAGFRNHYGTGPRYGVTEHFSGNPFGYATTPANSTTINNWMVLNGFSTGANGVLGVAVDNNTLATKALNATTNGGLDSLSYDVNPTEAIVMGATEGVGANITALMADQIMFQQVLNQPQRDEVAVYLAQKYKGVGNQVPVTASGQTYDLSVSAGKGALLDDVLQLGSSALGAGNDTITVAGRDYVNAGAGNDRIATKDLNFRSLDGGQGFDTFALHNGYSGSNSITLADYVSNARGMGSGGGGGLFGRDSTIGDWIKGSSAATAADNVQLAPDLTLTADQMNLTSQKTAYDYYKLYAGLTPNTSYTFSIWVKLGTATDLNITLNNANTAGTIAGDAVYTAANGLSTTAWKRIDHTFTTDSAGAANVMLGSAPTSETSNVQSAGSVHIWGAELNLSTSVPPVPTTQQLVDDLRVNTNGYHKLLGFEALDFSQSTAKQTVTIAAVDVDQLAEKNLSTDPQKAASTSNLYVALGANDYITPTGFGAVSYGYWLDAAGTAYERKYTGAVGGDTAALYVRNGDDAPDLGFTASSGGYSANGVSLDFSETMSVASLTASEFTINGNAATSATMTAGGLNLGYAPGGLTGLVRVIYTGTAIQDQETDQLRYKDITLGTSFADTISAAGRDTNQAILGGAGGDTITGGNKDDLLMGMSGNDNLTGGTGADTFRFIQFETGTDTITDFTKTQGDKIDLRGILRDSGFDSSDALSNLSSFLNITQSGTDVVLKVDDQGIGNFALPTQTIIMSGAANGTTNLYDGTALATLNQLIDQRVILV